MLGRRRRHQVNIIRPKQIDTIHRPNVGSMLDQKYYPSTGTKLLPPMPPRLIHQLRGVLYAFSCVQHNFVFFNYYITLRQKITRVDIPYPGNKEKIQDGRQDGRG